MEAETVDNILFVRGDVNNEPLTQFWGGGGPFEFMEACECTRPRVYDANCMIPCSKEGDCRLYYLQQSLMTVLTNAASYGALDTELDVILGDQHCSDMLRGRKIWS